MADLARIKNNVRKMAAQNAPEADIDGYIASEGVTLDDVRNFKPEAAPAPESQMSQDLRGELSAMTLNPGKAKYDALSGWQKPIVAASDMLQLGASGATFGFGDKAVAAVRAPFTDQTYAEELAAQRGLTQGARNRAGYAGNAAEFGGAVAAPLALASKGLTLAGRGGTAAMEGVKGLAARSGLMAAEGAGYGAMSALGNDQDVATGAGIGALAGGAGNVIGEGISAGVSKVAGAFNKKPAIPSNEELRATAKAAYQTADDAGVIFKSNSMDNLSNEVRKDLAEFGFEPALQPRISTVLDVMERMKGKNVTLKGVDILRRVVNNARQSIDPSEREIGGRIVDKIDDFLESATASDAVTGEAKTAAIALKQARQAWSRMRKSELVDEAILKAERRAASTGSGGNPNNQIRQNLRGLLDNPKKARFFTADEKAAIDEVVRGTPTQNAMRLVGKLSPNGNGLMLALGIGGAAVNPLSMVASGAGYVAKEAADRGTIKGAEMVSDLVRAGGNRSALSAAPNALQRLSKAKRESLSRILMGLGVATAGRPE